MEETGLEELDKYVLRCQKTMAHYIKIRQILELCLETQRMPVARVTQNLWGQEGLELVCTRTAESVEMGM